MFLEEGVQNLGDWRSLFFSCFPAPPRGLVYYSRHIDFLHVLTQWTKASGRERQTNTVNNEKNTMKVKQCLRWLCTRSRTDSWGGQWPHQSHRGWAFSKTAAHWASRGSSRALSFSPLPLLTIALFPGVLPREREPCGKAWCIREEGGGRVDKKWGGISWLKWVFNFLVNLNYTHFPWGLLLQRIKTLQSFLTEWKFLDCQFTSF